MCKKTCLHGWKIIQVTYHRFIHDRLSYSASALTYTTLLALVPLLAVIISILSAFPVFQSISTQLQHFIFSNLIPESGEVIRNYLQDFVAQTGRLSAIGTVFLIVTAIMMMITVDSALNDIWHVKKQQYTVTAIIRYWAVLSLAPLFIALSIAATSYLVSLPLISENILTLKITAFLSGVIPYLFTFIAFSLLYIVVPNCYVPIRSGLLGALIATLLFECGKRIFVVYLTHFPTYRLIYGAIAAVPIFLIWIYISWVIILFGALISSVLTNCSFIKEEGKMDGLTHALLWLGYLWKAQQQGDGLTLHELNQSLKKEYQIEEHRLIEILVQKNLIHSADHYHYRLSRDLSRVTLRELYETLPWKLPEKIGSTESNLDKLIARANHLLKEPLQVPLAQLFENYFQQ